MGYYYNIKDDIAKYPDAWCYIVVGGRGKGKTYGTLKDCYEDKIQFIFTKRTNRDVDLLTAGSGSLGAAKSKFGMDFSPFKSINRDLGCNVKAFKIDDGIGGFWNCAPDDDGEEVAEGLPIGTLISLNSVSKFAGFDMSDSEWLIFDEFIPRPWEKVNRKEGDQLLDLYKTVQRDREHRGKPPLKLICLANAVSISNSVTNILEVVDILADMAAYGTEYYYDPDRGIMIHLLPNDEAFDEKEKESMLFKAMGNTDWGKMAFENEFAYNDTSSVNKVQLKGYKCVCSYIYKDKTTYIYQKDGHYYVSGIRGNTEIQYNLKRENEQKKFYYDMVLDLRNECIEGNVTFQKYSMYDLIVNFHKIFVIR